MGILVLCANKYFLLTYLTILYRDGVVNTVQENSTIFFLLRIH